jgi:hypothetical protein
VLAVLLSWADMLGSQFVPRFQGATCACCKKLLRTRKMREASDGQSFIFLKDTAAFFLDLMGTVVLGHFSFCALVPGFA